MELGKIYKYTNLINGMVHIGQTKQTLEQRDYKHQMQLNDNTYFHRAIKKYGRNNFSLELVEDNIPLSELRERANEIPKDKTVYLHCRTGQRSYNAALALQHLGYDNVVNITGSFLGLSFYEAYNDKLKNRESIVTNYNFK